MPGIIFADETTQTAVVVGISFLLVVVSVVVDFIVRRRHAREDEIELANACLRYERAERERVQS